MTTLNRLNQLITISCEDNRIGIVRNGERHWDRPEWRETLFQRRPDKGMRTGGCPISSMYSTGRIPIHNAGNNCI
jgi:hypothetical protein